MLHLTLSPLIATYSLCQHSFVVTKNDGDKIETFTSKWSFSSFQTSMMLILLKTLVSMLYLTLSPLITTYFLRQQSFAVTKNGGDKIKTFTPKWIFNSLQIPMMLVLLKKLVLLLHFTLSPLIATYRHLFFCASSLLL